MPKKLEKFEVKHKDKPTTLALLQINAEVGRRALQEYNRAFSSAVKSGALLRSALQNYMREQNVWNDDKEKQYQDLIQKINESSDKLARGGIKLAGAKQIALDMRRARVELRELITERTSLDTNTAEGQAENARFNYIVSEVTVYDDTGDSFFKDLDDYITRATEDASVEAASRLGQVLYGLDTDYEKNLPENKFLVKWRFANEALSLVDKAGHLVDEEGRLINEDGRYIDVDGNYIDVDGNPITEQGELRVEAEPFLDEDGKPLAPPDEEPPATVSGEVTLSGPVEGSDEA